MADTQDAAGAPQDVKNAEAALPPEADSPPPTPITKVIIWPSCDQFTADLGVEKINEFMDCCWEKGDKWRHCTDFLRQETNEHDVSYKYQAKWSIPTQQCPIPKATASVFFTIQVSTVKPGSLPVNVFYVFESSRLVHLPGFSLFREKWLQDIIDNKENMIADIKF